MDIQVIASSSKGNCYRIDDGKTPLLLDCGLSVKSIQRSIGFTLSSVAGVLVTHEHNDHSKAVKDIMQLGVDCYMSQGTALAIQAEGYRLHIVENKKQFKIGSWTVLPFDCQHDCAEPLGFMLVNQDRERLLYATDTYYIRYKFPGLTHVLIECNHSYKILDANVLDGALSPERKKRLIQSHFSLENVKKFLQSNDLSKVREIYLIHLSDDNSDAELFKREIQALTGKLVIVAGS